MTVKSVAKIAMMASIQAAVFTIFSQVLYLEGITFTVCLFACVFTRKESVLASLVFGLTNCLIQGITIWSLMYVVIYPAYSYLIATWRDSLLKRRVLLIVIVGFFSLLTGQLLDFPFILFSKTVTIFYIIMGLKTSIIQGMLSAILTILLFDRCYEILIKIERKLR